MALTAHVNIKTPQSQISLTLPVVDALTVIDLLDPTLLSFHVLPPGVAERIQPLKGLPSARHAVDTEEIIQARLALERWFHRADQDHDSLGRRRPYSDYKLRHIIPRSSKATATATATNECDDARRRTLAIQKPVQRFHTDSTHTAFTNIWLPVSKVTDHFLGFLYHPASQQLVTAQLLEHASVSSALQQRAFLQSCWIIYHPSLDYGLAIVFRSGGRRGVLHGSFRIVCDVLDDSDQGPYSAAAAATTTTTSQPNKYRESVEFRCQKFDTAADAWVYGDSDDDEA